MFVKVAITYCYGFSVYNLGILATIIDVYVREKAMRGHVLITLLSQRDYLFPINE